MNFESWEPVYEAILSDFGYERTADERARDLLVDLLSGSDVRGVEHLDIAGTVAIAGAADTLEDDLDLAEGADVVFGASDAASRLREAGITVDCMVTDLDKRPDTAREFAAQGTPVAVHAHGDNAPALREFVPELDPATLVPTTQARPVGPVRNFGGFTDGDRARSWPTRSVRTVSSSPDGSSTIRPSTRRNDTNWPGPRGSFSGWNGDVTNGLPSSMVDGPISICQRSRPSEPCFAG